MGRQDRALRYIRHVDVRSARFVALPAPVSTTRVTCITREHNVLDCFGRHIDPAPIDEHPYPSWGHLVGRGLAIEAVAAVPAMPVLQRGVGIMGSERQRQAGDENDGNKGRSGKHGTLPNLAAWALSWSGERPREIESQPIRYSALDPGVAVL